jgi:LPXTG-motif cell wall-anchored protein
MATDEPLDGGDPMIRRAVHNGILALVAAVALVVVAPTAASAQYPINCGFLIDPPVVAPGATVSITGVGAEPGSTLEARLGDVVLGTTTTGGDGTFEFPSLVIPNTLAPGDYTVTVSVSGGGTFSDECAFTDVLTNVLTVQAPPPRPGGDQGGAGNLPRTGSDSVPMAQIGAALLGIGGLLVLAARKRDERPVNV